MASDGCPGSALGYLITVQGVVEISSGTGGNWQPLKINSAVCGGELIRVGQDSRAGIYYDDIETVTYVDQNTTARIAQRPAERSLILELLEGAINFLSREPRSLEIRTPFVNAGVKGTEFEVRVTLERPATGPLAGSAAINLIEGRVEVRGAGDSKVLTSGQSGIAAGTCPADLSIDDLRQGMACQPAVGRPAIRVTARAPDTVQWALYYPPITADAAGGLPADLAQVNRLLSRGRVDEALPILCAEPTQGEKSALIAIVELTRNDPLRGAARTDACGRPSQRDNRQRAVDFAEQSVRMSPQSAAAWVALSYAQQAYGKLDEARASLEKGVAAEPRNALVHARLAEIWLSLGYRDRALEEAAAAKTLASNLSRTQTVYGFAALAEIDINRARLAFTTAIQLDSADPLPRLGLGLAKIRAGDIAGGRRELEIAAGLDPQNALIRAYLGKAYFEEKRSGLDAAQFDLAKALDPNDPTPWLYDAIRLETENRPVEALHAIQKSIELNDNRAVYRSRLDLDEDLAVRGSQLGKIYRDLGFEQLALVEGWKSLTIDPSNYAAHRLLSDTYVALPRHEIARDSELLQAQLLQPLNVTPVQPRLADNGLAFLEDVGPADVGYNEFTRLFAADQLRLQADGLAGSENTFADNLIFSGILGRASFSLGQFHFESDGIRQNDDFNQDIYDAFLQVRLSDSTSGQLELRAIEEDLGDTAQLFFPNNFLPEFKDRFSDHSVRVGLRHDFTPSDTVIGSYTYGEFDDDTDFGDGFRISTDASYNFIELRHLHQGDWFNLTGGFGYFKADAVDTETIDPNPAFQKDADVEHTNGYVYANIRYPKDVTWTVGVSGDLFEDNAVARKQVNPKIGLTWSMSDQTTLRVALFRALKRTVAASQTIEPTQVAGFNQFFDDDNGTSSWRYGAAIDHRFSDNLFGGIEYSERRLEAPIRFTSGPVDFHHEERLASAYLLWAPTERFAVGTAYQYEEFNRDSQGLNSGALVESVTHKVPIEVRYFHPSGFFGLARTTIVNQEGTFGTMAGVPARGDDFFAVVDAAIGYRFPDRMGFVSLEVQNLFDERFHFQDSDPTNPRIIPDQRVFARLKLAF